MKNIVTSLCAEFIPSLAWPDLFTGVYFTQNLTPKFM